MPTANATLTSLSTCQDGSGFPLAQGDVDTLAGPVFDGERAVKRIIEWVEANSGWEESLLIVTADHGHMLVLDDREALGERLGAGSDTTERK